MIRLAEKPPEPTVLRSRKVERAKEAIEEKVASGEPLSSKSDFPRYWTDDAIRKVIWNHQHKKCCYCERKRDMKREADIEHFRPKTETAEDGNPGYWWLAYDWDNLFFSCKACNQTKSSKFPLVDGDRARVPTDDINSERPILPHPVNEDSEEIIGYIWDESSPVEQVRPRGKDLEGRGDETIKILGLDRLELTSEQSRCLLSLEGIVAKYHVGNLLNPDARDEAIEEIRKLTAPQNEFAGFKRAYFRARGLGEFVSRDR